MASLRNAAISLRRLHGEENIAEACRTTALSQHRGIHLLQDHQKAKSAA
jgi:hypothetical protein